MVLRMNGDGRGPNTLHNLLPVLNQRYVDKGNKYFIGIDFIDGDTMIAAPEVADITSGALNAASIQAIELCNEPNGYVAGGVKSSYSYRQFLTDEQSFWNAISPVSNGLKFAA